MGKHLEMEIIDNEMWFADNLKTMHAKYIVHEDSNLGLSVELVAAAAGVEEAEEALLVALAASEGGGGPGGRAEESELNSVLYLLDTRSMRHQ